MKATTFFVCALLISSSATAAWAEGWTITAGAKASVSPPYEGADHFVARPVPTLSIRPADQPYRFTPPDGGTTLALIDSRYISFGPMARFLYGRGDRGQLAGLRRVRWAAEPGAFLDLWPARWLRLHGELRHGVVGHSGLVGDTGADLVYMGPKWDLSVGPRMGFGDRKYFDRYFGVTPQEAAQSPLINAAYVPGDGRRYTGAELAGAYHLTRGVTIKGDVGYHRLSGKAADSPIVAVAGSRDQFSGSLGISLSFGVGR